MASSDSKVCCTCLQPPADGEEYYYSLDADPLSSNANLKEQLICCVPEFAEVLAKNEKLLMCMDCCLGLCWGYVFRKRCLDVKKEMEMAKNKTDFPIKEEVAMENIDLGETPPQNLAIENDVNPEEDGCRYSIVEIVEPAILEFDEPDAEFQIIKKACDTIPIPKENSVTPNQLKCTVNVKLLNDMEIKQLHKRKNSSKQYTCNICGKHYSKLQFLKCHKKRHNKRKPDQKVHKEKLDSSIIDLLASQFQDFSLRKKQVLEADMPSLSPQLNRKKNYMTLDEGMPLLFPSTQLATNTNLHTTEPLRRAILNFKQNHPAYIDLCENNPHETFGITLKPSFPTHNIITIPENLRFVNEDDLSKNMNVYMSSILKKFDPKAVNPQSVAVQSDVESEIENSDHTYSLLSRKLGVKCVECGLNFNNSEQFDMHIQNYHSGWWFTEVSHVETEMEPHVLEEYSQPKLTVDFEEELDYAPLTPSQSRLQNTVLEHIVDETEGFIVAQDANENFTEIILEDQGHKENVVANTKANQAMYEGLASLDRVLPSSFEKQTPQTSEIATQNTPNRLVKICENIILHLSKEEVERYLNQPRVVGIPKNKPLNPDVPVITKVHKSTANIQQQRETQQKATITNQDLQQNVQNRLFILPSVSKEVRFYATSTGNSVTFIPLVPMAANKVIAVPPTTPKTDDADNVLMVSKIQPNTMVPSPVLVVNAAGEKVLSFKKNSELEDAQPLQVASVINETSERGNSATVNCATVNSIKDGVKDQSEDFTEETTTKVSDVSKLINPLLSTANPFVSSIEMDNKKNVFPTDKSILKKPLALAENINKQTNKVLMQRQHSDSLKRSADHLAEDSCYKGQTESTNTVENGFNQRSSTELKENELSKEPPTKKQLNTESNFKKAYLSGKMKSAMEKAERKRLAEAQSKIGYEPLITIEQKISEINVTIPKWVHSGNERHCKFCNIFLNTDSRILHLDNYHTENKRRANNAALSSEDFCNALIKTAESKCFCIETTICPTCKNTFNVTYYEKAHKQICGVVLPVNKEKQAKDNAVDLPNEDRMEPEIKPTKNETNKYNTRGRSKSLSRLNTLHSKKLEVSSGEQKLLEELQEERDCLNGRERDLMCYMTVEQKTPTNEQVAKYNTRSRSKSLSRLNTLHSKKLEVSSGEQKLLEELQEERDCLNGRGRDLMCYMTVEQKTPTNEQVAKYNTRSRSKSLSRLRTIHPKKLEISLEEEKHKDCANRRDLMCDRTLQQNKTKKEATKNNRKARSKSLSRLSTIYPKTLEVPLEEQKVPEKLQEETHRDCVNVKNLMCDNVSINLMEENHHAIATDSSLKNHNKSLLLELGKDEKKTRKRGRSNKKVGYFSKRSKLTENITDYENAEKKVYSSGHQKETNRGNELHKETVKTLESYFMYKVETGFQNTVEAQPAKKPRKRGRSKKKDDSFKEDISSTDDKYKKTTKKEATKNNRRQRSKSLSSLSTIHPKMLEVRLEEEKVPEKLQKERHRDCVNVKNLMCDKTVEPKTPTKKETTKYNTRARSKSLSRLSDLRPEKDNSMKFDLEVNFSKESKEEKRKGCLQKHEEISATHATTGKTKKDVSSQMFTKQVESDETETTESEDLENLVLRLEEDELFDVDEHECLDSPLSYDKDPIVVQSVPSDQNLCRHCRFNLGTDNIKHFDNYHIENKRQQDNNRRDTCVIYCEAFNNLKNHEIDVETIDCLQCNVKFNTDYYNQAHKLICQKTIKRFQETKICTDLNVLKFQNQKPVKKDERDAADN